MITEKYVLYIAYTFSFIAIFGAGLLCDLPVPLLGSIYLVLIFLLYSVCRYNCLLKSDLFLFGGYIITSTILTVLFIIKYYFINFHIDIFILILLFGIPPLISFIVNKIQKQ
jgi:hypothetical protein